ncbi:serine/arginine repetitive matrix protein 1-like [Psammomys obesus]|uniref:serine/arginine repetitive matrix protein 1-like n=1 Tax=Psammomys obesus TaxID=48139 RepID=UPI002452A70A|nr:serine/arginine repetitive matrix protein 1-like [Psammomys obesus]
MGSPGSRGTQRASPAPLPGRRPPSPPRGARTQLPSDHGLRALRRRAGRPGREESPCRGPAAPSSPVRGEVPPAITLSGLRSGPARRGEAMPGLWGGEPRRVAAPSPPRLSPAASAAGSRSVARAETALPPALPIPLSARLDLSRLPGPPPRPASRVRAHRGPLRKARRAAESPLAVSAATDQRCGGLPLGRRRDWRTP